MKFIHTADWHLGNRMHDIDRNIEQQNFFYWLKDEIEKQNAQALVVSGDIYDCANPPVESRRQYIQFLTSLVGTCCKNVVIVGGNHDSGALLDSEKDILELLNIHVVGSIANMEIGDAVFELYDSDGKTSAICCAIPYARESELRQFFDEQIDDGTFSDRAYKTVYKKALDIAKKMAGKKNIPIIATGHLYAANLEGRLSGAKKETKTDDGIRMLDVVGKLGSVHADIFPEDFDYVALGHIHYSTMVDKKNKVRYSGSPFLMGFDEANIERNILEVEIDSDHKTCVKKIAVPQTFDFRRISGNCRYIIEELAKYKNNPPEKNTFVEAYFVQEDGINIHSEIEKIEDEFPENVSVVSVKAQTKFFDSESHENLDMDELKNFDEEEIFKKLILQKKASLFFDLPDEQKEKTKSDLIEKYLPIFMEVAAEVERGEN